MLTSVCIPAYKQPDMVLRAVHSVLQQQGCEFEVIIADDTPDDSVLHALQDVLQDPRVRYAKNPCQLGAVANWNNVVRQARGRIIRLLHHDDWLAEPHALMKAAVPILHEGATAVFSASRDLSVTGEVLREHKLDEARAKAWLDQPFSLAKGNFIGSPSVLTYDRERFAQDYDDSYSWLVDVEFFVRLASLAKGGCVYLPDILVNITNDSPHQLSRGLELDSVRNFKESSRLFSSPYIRRAFPFFDVLGYFQSMAISLGGWQSLRQFIWALSSGHYIPALAIIGLYVMKVGRFTFLVLWRSLRKVVPMQRADEAYSRFKRWNEFKRQFHSFAAASSNTMRNIRVVWEERYPCLRDATSETGFDAHYIYHPSWAARVLSETRPVRHVDISSTLNFCALVSAFVPVDFFDFRPAALRLPGLRTAAANVTALDWPSESVSSLSCMHVLEHIGLGRYGDPIDADGDLKAIAELCRVLAPGGDLLIAVPVGRERVCFNAHRVYDAENFVSYFSGLCLQEYKLIPDGSVPDGWVDDPDFTRSCLQSYGCGCFWFRKPVSTDMAAS